MTDSTHTTTEATATPVPVLVLVAAMLVAACSGADQRSEGLAEIVTIPQDDLPAETEVIEQGQLPPPAEPTDLGLPLPISERASELTGQFVSVEPGPNVFSSTGVSVEFDFGPGWTVRENAPAITVLTDDSRAPGAREIVLFRPTRLSNPADPTLGGPDRQFWPVDDIDGWLDRLPPGLLISAPSRVEVAGRDAVRFDVRVDGQISCSEDVYCVDFASGPGEQSRDFDPNIDYAVWWVDGLEAEPLAIIVQSRDAGFEAAFELLGSIRVGEAGPHPIDTEAVAWECGFSSEVGAGSITLPVAGGVSVELVDPTFVEQYGGVAEIWTRWEENRIVILGPTRDRQGNHVTTIEDVIEAIEATGSSVADAGSTDLAGFDTRIVNVERATDAPFDAVLLTDTGGGPLGWKLPRAGRLWLTETDRGVLAVALNSSSEASLEIAVESTEQLLTSLELSEAPC